MELRVVFCTIDRLEAAKKIANTLISEKLAACVNIIPKIYSVYQWKGEIVEDEEYLMIIKTRESLFEKLKKRINELHSYEVPEIVSFEIIDGAKPYLDWIYDSTIIS